MVADWVSSPNSRLKQTTELTSSTLQYFSVRSTVNSVKAGLDISMPGGASTFGFDDYYGNSTLIAAIDSGGISVEDINQLVSLSSAEARAELIVVLHLSFTPLLHLYRFTSLFHRSTA